MMFNKGYFLILTLLYIAMLLTGCASVGVQRIGSSQYPPLSPSEEVMVYTDESQINKPYKIIAIISYNNPGKYQVLTLNSAIEPLKEKARKVGANAIIIDKSRPVKSGIISTGIYVEARAIYIEK